VIFCHYLLNILVEISLGCCFVVLVSFTIYPNILMAILQYVAMYCIFAKHCTLLQYCNPPLYGTANGTFDPQFHIVPYGGCSYRVVNFPFKNDYDFKRVRKNISRPSAEYLIGVVFI